jgi:hypothetical protein
MSAAETTETFGVPKKTLLTRAEVLEKYARAVDLPNRIRDLEVRLLEADALFVELQSRPSEILEIYLAARAEGSQVGRFSVGGAAARRICSHMNAGTKESNWRDLLSGRLCTLITAHINWELKQRGLSTR